MDVCVCVYIYWKLNFVNFCCKLFNFFKHLVLPWLLLRLELLLDFGHCTSDINKLFKFFPFIWCRSLDCCCCCWGHSDSLADVVDVIGSFVFVVSPSLLSSGSPFRFTTFISTSTPWSFNATDYQLQRNGREWKKQRDSQWNIILYEDRIIEGKK